jgi:hypothetical protein
MAVADDRAAAVFVALVGVSVQAGAAFGLERDREHLARREPARLAQLLLHNIRV